jgi:hypothetical protein
MATDYSQPSAVEKRVRFFDGQFLQDQDFVDEQKYHLDRERRHNRLLHLTGVAEGLAVASGGANKVSVAPGTAIDGDGRQLVLAQPATVDLPAEKFNDKQGIELYLTYEESAQDRQKMLAELETRQFELRQTLLRIIGAIQVLEEILAEAEAVSGDMSSNAPARSDNGSNDARS